MKGPSKVKYPIISKIDRYKKWAIPFCKINVRVEK